MENVEVGRYSQIRKAIIDNNSTTLEDRLEGIEGNILPSGGTNG
jgi:ADP-glucose pyrophosphorylase